MSNPNLGFDELASGQAQPEVIVNAADRAITTLAAGEVTIDFAADADYTLQATAPPDAGDEWPYRVLRFTDSGTVLTAARGVVYPDLDTLYGGPSRPMHVVINETAQTLTVKRSGQTGVAVAAGTAALVYHDGTDIKAIVNPLP